MRAPSQTVLLATVEAGERTTGELAAALQSSPGTVGRRLGALEGLGVVRRRAVPGGRVVWGLVETVQRGRA